MTLRAWCTTLLGGILIGSAVDVAFVCLMPSLMFETWYWPDFLIVALVGIVSTGLSALAIYGLGEMLGLRGVRRIWVAGVLRAKHYSQGYTRMQPLITTVNGQTVTTMVPQWVPETYQFDVQLEEGGDRVQIEVARTVYQSLEVGTAVRAAYRLSRFSGACHWDSYVERITGRERALRRGYGKRFPGAKQT